MGAERATDEERLSDHERTRPAAGVAGGPGVVGTGRAPSPGQLLAIQRTAGNRAAASLAQPIVIQRERKTNKQRQREKKQRQQKQQKRRHDQSKQATPQTPAPAQAPAAGGGWWASLTRSFAFTADGDGEFAPSDVTSAVPQRWERELEAGDPEPEEESPADLLSKFIEIPRVEIKLASEGDLLGGEGAASGAASLSKSGGAAKGEITWEKAFKGEKSPFNINKDSKDNRLTTKGTFFAGIKGGLELDAAINRNRVGAKGQLAAFAGTEISGETEVLLTVGNRKVKVRGQGGLAFGLGGEVAGWINFEGGSLRYGSKGKLAIGLGGTWEWELVLPVASVTNTMWSWLSAAGLGAWNTGSSWYSWMTGASAAAPNP